MHFLYCLAKRGDIFTVSSQSLMWASIFPFHQRSLSSDWKENVPPGCKSMLEQSVTCSSFLLAGGWGVGCHVDFQFPSRGFKACLCWEEAVWQTRERTSGWMYVYTGVLCRAVRKSFHFTSLDSGTEMHRDCKILGCMPKKRKEMSNRRQYRQPERQSDLMQSG